MKAGFLPGLRAEVEFDVKPEHLAAFEGKVVHPVLSTWSMIHFMEWAGRRVILPFLEPEEEAVGASLEVRHLAPTVEGERVRVTATLTRFEPPKIVCHVEARSSRDLIGTGTFVQILLPRQRVQALIAEARTALAAERGKEPRHDGARAVTPIGTVRRQPGAEAGGGTVA